MMRPEAPSMLRYGYSSGIPRMLNIGCHGCKPLHTQKTVVAPKSVKDSAADMPKTHRPSRFIVLILNEAQSISRANSSIYQS
jgi:hypothetical protein